MPKLPPSLPADSSESVEWTSLAYPTGAASTSMLGIEKGMPREVRTGRTFEYKLIVSNLTDNELQDVVVQAGHERLRAVVTEVRVDGDDVGARRGRVDPFDPAVLGEVGRAAVDAGEQHHQGLGVAARRSVGDMWDRRRRAAEVLATAGAACAQQSGEAGEACLGQVADRVLAHGAKCSRIGGPAKELTTPDK